MAELFAEVGDFVLVLAVASDVDAVEEAVLTGAAASAIVLVDDERCALLSSW